MKSFWLLLIFSLAAMADSFLGPGQEATVKNFHTQSLLKDGKYSWMLDGRDAVANGNLLELKNFALVFLPDNGQEYDVTSSECRFLYSLREVKSDAAIQIKSTGISASGIGYDIHLDKRMVRIRTTVKIVIQRSKLDEHRLDKQD